MGEYRCRAATSNACDRFWAFNGGCEIWARASARSARLTHRSIFREASTWMEIHGATPEIVEHWITMLAERGADEPVLPVGKVGRPPGTGHDEGAGGADAGPCSEPK